MKSTIKKIMPIVIFWVVLLIPVIYSFFYLKSYWDPYGDLTGLQIAIVNLDEGENGENQGKVYEELHEWDKLISEVY
jgi:putative membrane protein